MIHRRFSFRRRNVLVGGGLAAAAAAGFGNSSNANISISSPSSAPDWSKPLGPGQYPAGFDPTSVTADSPYWGAYSIPVAENPNVQTNQRQEYYPVTINVLKNPGDAVQSAIHRERMRSKYPSYPTTSIYEKQTTLVPDIPRMRVNRDAQLQTPVIGSVSPEELDGFIGSGEAQRSPTAYETFKDAFSLLAGDGQTMPGSRSGGRPGGVYPLSALGRSGNDDTDRRWAGWYNDPNAAFNSNAMGIAARAEQERREGEKNGDMFTTPLSMIGQFGRAAAGTIGAGFVALSTFVGDAGRLETAGRMIESIGHANRIGVDPDKLNPVKTTAETGLLGQGAAAVQNSVLNPYWWEYGMADQLGMQLPQIAASVAMSFNPVTGVPLMAARGSLLFAAISRPVREWAFKQVPAKIVPVVNTIVGKAGTSAATSAVTGATKKVAQYGMAAAPHVIADAAAESVISAIYAGSETLAATGNPELARKEIGRNFVEGTTILMGPELAEDLILRKLIPNIVARSINNAPSVAARNNLVREVTRRTVGASSGLAFSILKEMQEERLQTAIELNVGEGLIGNMYHGLVNPGNNQMITTAGIEGAKFGLGYKTLGATKGAMHAYKYLSGNLGSSSPMYAEINRQLAAGEISGAEAKEKRADVAKAFLTPEGSRAVIAFVYDTFTKTIDSRYQEVRDLLSTGKISYDQAQRRREELEAFVPEAQKIFLNLLSLDVTNAETASKTMDGLGSGGDAAGPWNAIKKARGLIEANGMISRISVIGEFIAVLHPKGKAGVEGILNELLGELARSVDKQGGFNRDTGVFGGQVLDVLYGETRRAGNVIDAGRVLGQDRFDIIASRRYMALIIKTFDLLTAGVHEGFQEGAKGEGPYKDIYNRVKRAGLMPYFAGVVKDYNKRVLASIANASLGFQRGSHVGVDVHSIYRNSVIDQNEEDKSNGSPKEGYEDRLRARVSRKIALTIIHEIGHTLGIVDHNSNQSDAYDKLLETLIAGDVRELIGASGMDAINEMTENILKDDEFKEDSVEVDRAVRSRTNAVMAGFGSFESRSGVSDGAVPSGELLGSQGAGNGNEERQDASGIGGGIQVPSGRKDEESSGVAASTDVGAGGPVIQPSRARPIGPTDAGSTDAGSTGAGSTDAGSTDAGSTDAGSTGAGSTGAGSTDAGGQLGAGSTDADASQQDDATGVRSVATRYQDLAAGRLEVIRQSGGIQSRVAGITTRAGREIEGDFLRNPQHVRTDNFGRRTRVSLAEFIVKLESQLTGKPVAMYEDGTVAAAVQAVIDDQAAEGKMVTPKDLHDKRVPGAIRPYIAYVPEGDPTQDEPSPPDLNVAPNKKAKTVKPINPNDPKGYDTNEALTGIMHPELVKFLLFLAEKGKGSGSWYLNVGQFLVEYVKQELGKRADDGTEFSPTDLDSIVEELLGYMGRSGQETTPRTNMGWAFQFLELRLLLQQTPSNAINPITKAKYKNALDEVVQTNLRIIKDIQTLESNASAKANKELEWRKKLSDITKNKKDMNSAINFIFTSYYSPREGLKFGSESNPLAGHLYKYSEIAKISAFLKGKGKSFAEDLIDTAGIEFSDDAQKEEFTTHVNKLYESVVEKKTLNERLYVTMKKPEGGSSLDPYAENEIDVSGMGKSGSAPVEIALGFWTDKGVEIGSNMKLAQYYGAFRESLFNAFTMFSVPDRWMFKAFGVINPDKQGTASNASASEFVMTIIADIASKLDGVTPTQLQAMIWTGLRMVLLDSSTVEVNMAEDPKKPGYFEREGTRQPRSQWGPKGKTWDPDSKALIILDHNNEEWAIFSGTKGDASSAGEIPEIFGSKSADEFSKKLLKLIGNIAEYAKKITANKGNIVLDPPRNLFSQAIRPEDGPLSNVLSSERKGTNRYPVVFRGAGKGVVADELSRSRGQAGVEAMSPTIIVPRGRGELLVVDGTNQLQVLRQESQIADTPLAQLTAKGSTLASPSLQKTLTNFPFAQKSIEDSKKHYVPHYVNVMSDHYEVVLVGATPSYARVIASVLAAKAGVPSAQVWIPRATSNVDSKYAKKRNTASTLMVKAPDSTVWTVTKATELVTGVLGPSDQWTVGENGTLILINPANIDDLGSIADALVTTGGIPQDSIRVTNIDMTDPVAADEKASIRPFMDPDAPNFTAVFLANTGIQSSRASVQQRNNRWIPREGDQHVRQFGRGWGYIPPPDPAVIKRNLSEPDGTQALLSYGYLQLGRDFVTSYRPYFVYVQTPAGWSHDEYPYEVDPFDPETIERYNLPFVSSNEDEPDPVYGPRGVALRRRDELLAAREEYEEGQATPDEDTDMQDEATLGVSSPGGGADAGGVLSSRPRWMQEKKPKPVSIGSEKLGLRPRFTWEDFTKAFNQRVVYYPDNPYISVSVPGNLGSATLESTGTTMPKAFNEGLTPNEGDAERLQRMTLENVLGAVPNTGPLAGLLKEIFSLGNNSLSIPMLQEIVGDHVVVPNRYGTWYDPPSSGLEPNVRIILNKDVSIDNAMAAAALLGVVTKQDGVGVWYPKSVVPASHFLGPATPKSQRIWKLVTVTSKRGRRGGTPKKVTPAFNAQSIARELDVSSWDAGGVEYEMTKLVKIFDSLGFQSDMTILRDLYQELGPMGSRPGRRDWHQMSGDPSMFLQYLDITRDMLDINSIGIKVDVTKRDKMRVVAGELNRLGFKSVDMDSTGKFVLLVDYDPFKYHPNMTFGEVAKLWAVQSIKVTKAISIIADSKLAQPSDIFAGTWGNHLVAVQDAKVSGANWFAPNVATPTTSIPDSDGPRRWHEMGIGADGIYAFDHVNNPAAFAPTRTVPMLASGQALPSLNRGIARVMEQPVAVQTYGTVLDNYFRSNPNVSARVKQIVTEILGQPIQFAPLPTSASSASNPARVGGTLQEHGLLDLATAYTKLLNENRGTIVPITAQPDDQDRYGRFAGETRVRQIFFINDDSRAAQRAAFLNKLDNRLQGDREGLSAEKVTAAINDAAKKAGRKGLPPGVSVERLVREIVDRWGAGDRDRGVFLPDARGRETPSKLLSSTPRRSVISSSRATITDEMRERSKSTWTYTGDQWIRDFGNGVWGRVLRRANVDPKAFESGQDIRHAYRFGVGVSDAANSALVARQLGNLLRTDNTGLSWGIYGTADHTFIGVEDSEHTVNAWKVISMANEIGFDVRNRITYAEQDLGRLGLRAGIFEIMAPPRRTLNALYQLHPQKANEIMYHIEQEFYGDPTLKRIALLTPLNGENYYRPDDTDPDGTDEFEILKGMIAKAVSMSTEEDIESASGTLLQVPRPFFTRPQFAEDFTMIADVLDKTLGIRKEAIDPETLKGLNHEELINIMFSEPEEDFDITGTNSKLRIDDLVMQGNAGIAKYYEKYRRDKSGPPARGASFMGTSEGYPAVRGRPSPFQAARVANFDQQRRNARIAAAFTKYYYESRGLPVPKKDEEKTQRQLDKQLRAIDAAEAASSAGPPADWVDPNPQQFWDLYHAWQKVNDVASVFTSRGTIRGLTEGSTIRSSQAGSGRWAVSPDGTLRPGLIARNGGIRATRLTDSARANLIIDRGMYESRVLPLVGYREAFQNARDAIMVGLPPGVDKSKAVVDLIMVDGRSSSKMFEDAAFASSGEDVHFLSRVDANGVPVIQASDFGTGGGSNYTHSHLLRPVVSRPFADTFPDNSAYRAGWADRTVRGPSSGFFVMHDTGSGMSPETLGTTFIQMFSSGKEKAVTNSGTSGGFGIGVGSIFSAAQYFEVLTTWRDPNTGKLVRSVMHGTGDDFSDVNAGVAIRIISMDVEGDGLSAHPDPHRELALQQIARAEANLHGGEVGSFTQTFGTGGQSVKQLVWRGRTENLKVLDFDESPTNPRPYGWNPDASRVNREAGAFVGAFASWTDTISSLVRGYDLVEGKRVPLNAPNGSVTSTIRNYYDETRRRFMAYGQDRKSWDRYMKTIQRRSPYPPTTAADVPARTRPAGMDSVLLGATALEGALLAYDTAMQDVDPAVNPYIIMDTRSGIGSPEGIPMGMIKTVAEWAYLALQRDPSLMKKYMQGRPNLLEDPSYWGTGTTITVWPKEGVGIHAVDRRNTPHEAHALSNNVRDAVQIGYNLTTFTSKDPFFTNVAFVTQVIGPGDSSRPSPFNSATTAVGMDQRQPPEYNQAAYLDYANPTVYNPDGMPHMEYVSPANGQITRLWPDRDGHWRMGNSYQVGRAGYREEDLFPRPSGTFADIHVYEGRSGVLMPDKVPVDTYIAGSDPGASGRSVDNHSMNLLRRFLNGTNMVMMNPNRNWEESAQNMLMYPASGQGVPYNNNNGQVAGTYDVAYSDVSNNSNSVRIYLSNGSYQFSTEDNSISAKDRPDWMVIDIHPAVDPTDEGYPLTPNRDSVKSWFLSQPDRWIRQNIDSAILDANKQKVWAALSSGFAINGYGTPLTLVSSPMMLLDAGKTFNPSVVQGLSQERWLIRLADAVTEYYGDLMEEVKLLADRYKISESVDIGSQPNWFNIVFAGFTMQKNLVAVNYNTPVVAPPNLSGTIPRYVMVNPFVTVAQAADRTSGPGIRSLSNRIDTMANLRNLVSLVASSFNAAPTSMTTAQLIEHWAGEESRESEAYKAARRASGSGPRPTAPANSLLWNAREVVIQLQAAVWHEITHQSVPGHSESFGRALQDVFEAIRHISAVSGLSSQLLETILENDGEILVKISEFIINNPDVLYKEDDTSVRLTLALPQTVSNQGGQGGAYGDSSQQEYGGARDGANGGEPLERQGRRDGSEDPERGPSVRSSLGQMGRQFGGGDGISSGGDDFGNIGGDVRGVSNDSDGIRSSRAVARFLQPYKTPLPTPTGPLPAVALSPLGQELYESNLLPIRGTEIDARVAAGKFGPDIKAGEVPPEWIATSALWGNSKSKQVKGELARRGGERVSAFWYMNTLSAPSGAMVDIISNALTIPTTLLREINATVIERMGGVPREQRTASLEKLYGAVSSMWSSTMNAGRDALDAFAQGSEPIRGEQPRGFTSGKKGMVLETVGRARIAADVFVNNLTLQMAVHAIAHREAGKSEKFGTPAYRTEVIRNIQAMSEELANGTPEWVETWDEIQNAYFSRPRAQAPGSRTPYGPAYPRVNPGPDAQPIKQKGVPYEIRKPVSQSSESLAGEAFRQARENVFQERAPHLVSLIADQRGVAKGVLQAMIPFYRTIATIGYRGAISLTPMGLAGIAYDAATSLMTDSGPSGRADSRNPQDNFLVRQPKSREYLPMSQRLGYQMIGMTVAMMASAAFLGGMLTGAGPDDDEEKKAMEEEGWRPWSFVTTDNGGNKTYTAIVNVLGPLAYPVVFGAAWSEAHQKGGVPDAGAFGAFAASMWDFTFTQSGLKAYKEAFDALEGGRDMAKMKQAVSRYLSGFVPYVSLGRAINNAIDDTVRDPRGVVTHYTGSQDVDEWISYFVESAQQGIPGMADNIEPKRDEIGNVQRRFPGQTGVRAFFPFQSTEDRRRSAGEYRYVTSQSKAEDVRTAKGASKVDEFQRDLKLGIMGQIPSSEQWAQKNYPQSSLFKYLREQEINRQRRQEVANTPSGFR